MPEEMLKPQLIHEAEAEEYAGLVFFCKRDGKAICFYHSGWDEGFVCSMRLHNSGGKGAVVMLNSNEGYPLLDEIFQAIAHEYDWPQQRAEKAYIQLEDNTRYAGTYRTKSGVTAKIESVDNGLVLHFESQATIPFQARSKTCFASPVVNTELEFEINADGKIVQLMVKLDNLHMEMKKADYVPGVD